MNNIRLIISMLTIPFIFACGSKPGSPEQISTSSGSATAPYFTENEKGEPVLCWSEKQPGDSAFRLSYSEYISSSDSFERPTHIAKTAGLTVAAESMGRIAFKSDGSIIAIYGKSFATPSNRFAGGIYYTQSADGGKSWSEPAFIHSDTSRSVGRSFFDLERTADGEVAAVWLDGRHGRSVKGQSLYYSKTVKGGAFGEDKCLYKGTCECCRTDILSDDKGNIHVAFRNISMPPSAVGRQVRDMAYIVSRDTGDTFSQPVSISEDNWAIEGCPHTGPTLSARSGNVFAAWFTAGGTPGVYFSNKPASKFTRRQLISQSARHPQSISLDSGEILLVSEESSGGHSEHAGKSHNMSSMPAAGKARIVVRVLDPNGAVKKEIELSDGSYSDHHPVVANSPKGPIVAWVRDKEDSSVVLYSRIR